jgi:hypothetical protein
MPSVNISWTDNSDNETGFEVERRLSNEGGFSLLATVGPDITSYTDTNPPSIGISATYRVRAVGDFGNSEYSLEYTFTPAAPLPPSGLVAV